MIPELLAPAGNLSVAVTAYKNGADAVYAGMGKFNAREMADNFTFDDVSRLAEYARRRNKRYYLTFNTLVKEQELEEVCRTLEDVSSLEPHGIIVQDIGLVRIIREHFPDLEIHASTQMGIHNSAGIFQAREMGISRVILERQVTLGELKKIIRISPLEIEVFIHGALCCSLSGNCLFSSWIGGWSGNRGKCKQPCRRRFHYTDGGKKRSGFFFSTRDLYTLDMIEDLKTMGVASLKIEGRLKHEGYTAKVVQAYRLILDAPASEKEKTLREARGILAESYGRKWSHGFYSEHDMKEVLQPKNLGVSGLLAGSVTRVENSGFYMETLRRVQVGDRIRVQPKSGDEGPSFTVTKMHVKNRLERVARKGDTVFLHYPREVPREGLVFLTEKAAGKTVSSVNELPLFTPTAAVNLAVSISKDGIEITLPKPTGLPVWQKEIPVETARNRALDEESVRNLFSSTRIESIRTGTIDVFLEGELFVPLSSLKQARREFWEWARETITGEAESDYTRNILESAKDTDRKQHLPLRMYHLERQKKTSLPKGSMVSRSLDIIRAPNEEAVLPHFCPEGSLAALKSRIREVYHRGIRKFRVTSLFHIELLKDQPDITMVSSFPLPVANSLAAEELRGSGIESIQAWIELEKEAAEKLAAHSSAQVEQYIYGRPFLLATRAEVQVEGNIVDSRGKEFSVSRDSRTGLTYVFPSEVLEVKSIRGCSEFIDLTHADLDEPQTCSFNYEAELK